MVTGRIEPCIIKTLCVKGDLAPCKDRVLIGDTLYTDYKLLKMHYYNIASKSAQSNSLYVSVLNYPIDCMLVA